MILEMLIVNQLLVDILFAGCCGDKTDACNTTLNVHLCAINVSTTPKPVYSHTYTCDSYLQGHMNKCFLLLLISQWHATETEIIIISFFTDTQCKKKRTNVQQRLYI